MTNKVISVHANGHENRHDDHHDRLCMSRRQFLLAGGAMVTLAAIGLPGMAEAAPIHALKASFPKQKIGSLAALKNGIPLDFAYPYPDIQNILVKLGTVAGGGVGADKDIVAFTNLLINNVT